MEKDEKKVVKQELDEEELDQANGGHSGCYQVRHCASNTSLCPIYKFR